MAIALRPMRHEDRSAVLAIAAASPEAPQWRESDYGSYLDPAQPPLLRVAFVAESDGQVAGFAAATLVLDGAENRCDLDTMAVDPGARRRGMGRALLDAVLDWAAAGGARSIGLEVRASNASAQMLYRRAGFAQEGRRTAYYRHPDEDALVLGREVTAVSPAGSISTDKEVEGGASQC